MKKEFLTLAAVATMLAACNSESDNFAPPVDETKDTPITIQSAGVAELMTRVITDDKLVGTEDEPVEMGVFVTGGSADKYNATNVKWTHSGTAWEAASTTLYEGTSSAQQISAYYPYKEDATYDNGFTVTADGTTDYLVATPAKLESSTVSLAMNHALAKLVLSPTFGSEVTNKNISEVEVGYMYASSTWKFSNNTWDDLAENPSATLTMTNNEVLVIPMSCTSFPITITMEDGRVFKTDIGLHEVDYKLEAGNQYTINLQIGLDKVELDAITVKPWTSIEGGELETE